eukprot:GHRR01016414.1.p1 GENE.GHRR01016414.1~~GHRR01016414.1.p1  ORF type:complete len:273 (+),score=115.03 GHRR01016414.1:593-1411(+)
MQPPPILISVAVLAAVLSARLGCGKSGLSWSSEELLAESLQVEPGCVTPLALANQSSSKHVLLLIDQKLKNTKFFVHPIVNSASVLLDSAGLDTFVRSVGREPIYVDLEADPKIDRDNPPDLKQYADNIGAPTKENEEGTSNNSSSGAASSQANIAAAPAAKTASQASTATAASKGKKTTSSKTANAVQQSSAEQHIQLSDVVKRTEDLINMVSQALLSNPAAEAAASNDYVLKRLKADVQMQLTAFKNAAYSAGYTAGKEEIVAFATRRYA